MPDLDLCPGCGGPADNGHDRCFPPNPYYCTKCMDIESKDARIAALEATLLNMLKVPGDHMTACDRVMGDTHLCTCGADEGRATLRMWDIG